MPVDCFEQKLAAWSDRFLVARFSCCNLLLVAASVCCWYRYSIQNATDKCSLRWLIDPLCTCSSVASSAFLRFWNFVDAMLLAIFCHRVRCCSCCDPILLRLRRWDFFKWMPLDCVGWMLLYSWLINCLSRCLLLTLMIDFKLWDALVAMLLAKLLAVFCWCCFCRYPVEINRC